MLTSKHFFIAPHADRGGFTIFEWQMISSNILAQFQNNFVHMFSMLPYRYTLVKKKTKVKTTTLQITTKTHIQ